MPDDVLLPGTGKTIGASQKPDGVYIQEMLPVSEKFDFINVASEEAIMLLRRMVKLMESQGIVDTAQRQRVSVDNTVAITANQAINVAQVGGVAALMNLGLSGTGSQRVTVANDSQIDNVIALMRTAYNTSIRSQLTFS